MFQRLREFSNWIVWFPSDLLIFWNKELVSTNIEIEKASEILLARFRNNIAKTNLDKYNILVDIKDGTYQIKVINKTINIKLIKD